MPSSLRNETDYEDIHAESMGNANSCTCSRLCNALRASNKIPVVVMFMVFFLDMILLTSIEPILPDIVYNIDHHYVELMRLTQNTTPPSGADGNLSVGNMMLEDWTCGNHSINNVSSTTIGILNGAKPLTQVILNPLFGWIIDRSGHVVPMAAGFVCALVSTFGFAHGQTFWLLMVFRCCQGAASSLLTISGLAMLSDIFRSPEDRSRVMAYAFGGLTLGLIIGFPFGSTVYQYFGRKIPFYAISGIVVLCAMLRFCLMPVCTDTPSTPVNVQSKSSICSDAAVFVDCYVLLAAGVYFFLCYGIGSVMAIGPLFLLKVLDAEQWQIGIYFVVGAVSQTIVQFALGPYASRIGWWLMSMVGLFLVGIGTGTYVISHTMWLTVVPQIVYACGIGLIMGSNPSLLSHLADIRAKSRYGAVFALSDTGTNLGYFLGSTVTGILTERFGYLYVFVTTGSVIFVFGFTSIFYRNIPVKYAETQGDEKSPLAGSFEGRSSSLSPSV